MTQQTKERRKFGVHPAIILTLIREQAGTVSKAVAELIMNSVDAGATRIDIEIDADRFSITDNGKGFASREEIESFFENFGTPHEPGDAYFAKFRIGRGQIMSYARTTWRSGLFQMEVDLKDAETDAAYDLITLNQSSPGCKIEGEFYQHAMFSSGWGGFCGLIWLFKYLPVPVYLNGKQANNLPQNTEWDHEDEVAWYSFVPNTESMHLFNRGVFVESIDARTFGMGGTIVSKQPLRVNMARNAVVRHLCQTWQRINLEVNERFTFRLEKAKKLSEVELSKLFIDLSQDCKVDYVARAKILAIRGVKDVSGSTVTVSDLLRARCYTIYDGQHSMIAERVQATGRAFVLARSMLQCLNHDTRTHHSDSLLDTISTLRTRLGVEGDFEYIPFSDLIKEMQSESQLIPDGELKPEERLILDILRVTNASLPSIGRCSSKKHPWAIPRTELRRIVVGKSDTMHAWTDATSYIAVHLDAIKVARRIGMKQLMFFLLHEYCHTDSSLGDHLHDQEFFYRYHEATLHWAFGQTIDKMERKYIEGLAKLGMHPSGETRYHVTRLVALEQRLPRRKTRCPERHQR